MYLVLIVIAILLLALNIKATLVLVRSPRYNLLQKWLQCALIWFIPIIGALLVLSLAKDEPTERVTTDLTDSIGLDGYKIPDGVGEGIGRE